MKRAEITIFFDNTEHAGDKLAELLRKLADKVQGKTGYQLAEKNNEGVINNECFWPDGAGPSEGSVRFICPTPKQRPI